MPESGKMVAPGVEKGGIYSQAVEDLEDSISFGWIDEVIEVYSSSTM